MNYKFAVIILLLIPVSTSAQGYWTQCGAGEGMTNPLGGDADNGGTMSFYRWSSMTPYSYNGSTVTMATDFVTVSPVSGGGTLDKTDGYYYLAATIPMPATASLNQTEDYFTIIQFSVAVGASKPDVEDATGVNTTIMQDVFASLGVICGEKVTEATGYDSRIAYPYLGYAGESAGVYVRIPDSYEGQTLYVYCDAQTYDPNGYVVQHGYTEDSFLLLGSEEATPTPINTSTPTPTYTIPPSPTSTFTPTLTPTATRTPIPTNPPTVVIPTATPTYPPATPTPTVMAGVFNLTVSEIIVEGAGVIPAPIQIPDSRLLTIILRNTGSISASTDVVMSASDSNIPIIYGSWVVLAAELPAAGGETRKQCWLTTGGLSTGSHTIRAAINVADANISDNSTEISLVYVLPTPIPTEIPFPTPTQVPGATPTPYEDDEGFHVWRGMAWSGIYRLEHGILGFRYLYTTTPSTNGVTMDHYAYRFDIGDVIHGDLDYGDTLYLLSDANGEKEWLPIGYELYKRVDVLEGKVAELEIKTVTSPGDVIIYNRIGNIYGFEAVFSEPSQRLDVLFPSGKTIDPSGTFLAEIYGMSWNDYDIRYGYGNVVQGIQFHLDEDEWPVGARAKGLFQLIDADPPLVFFDFAGGAGDPVTIPSHTPETGLMGAVLRFE